LTSRYLRATVASTVHCEKIALSTPLTALLGVEVEVTVIAWDCIGFALAWHTSSKWSVIASDAMALCAGHTI